jgi:hypothetical protein
MAGTDVERDPVQDRFGAKMLLHTLDLENNHPASVAATDGGQSRLMLDTVRNEANRGPSLRFASSGSVGR